MSWLLPSLAIQSAHCAAESDIECSRVRRELAIGLLRALHDQFAGAAWQFTPLQGQIRQHCIAYSLILISHCPKFISLRTPALEQLFEYGGKFLSFKLCMQRRYMVVWCFGFFFVCCCVFRCFVRFSCL